MATQYANGKIVTDGLVLALNAADKNSYPGSGTTWTDLSGLNNNSTLNAATFDTTNGGRIIFNGSSTYISIPSNTDTRLLNNYQTLSQWVYITSVGPNGYSELYYSGAQYSNFTSIKWLSVGITFDVTLNVEYTIAMTNNYSEWMNITCVIDKVGNTFAVYKNGNFINSISFTTFSVSGTTTRIGSNLITGNSGDPMKGSIATTSIYNKLLSASEIAQNYNAQKSRFNLT